MDNAVKLFRYKWSLLAPLYFASWLIPLFIWLGVHLISIDHILLGIFFTAFAFLILIIIIRAHMQFSSVHVNDEGIGAQQFGHQWKFIRWQDIKKIIRVKELDPVSNSFKQYFYVSDSARGRNFHARKILSNTKNGAILFEERINGLGDLLRTINRFAAQYGIAIVAVDRMADSRRGRTIWRKLEPTEREVKISEL